MMFSKWINPPDAGYMSPRQHALLERLENDPGFMQALYEKALVPEDIPSMGKSY